MPPTYWRGYDETRLLAELRWVSPEEYVAMRTTVRWCPDSDATFPPLLGAAFPAWLIVQQ